MSFYFYVTYMILKDALPYKTECTMISSSKPVFPYSDVMTFLKLATSSEVMILTWQPSLKSEAQEFVKYADKNLSPREKSIKLS